MSASVSSSDAAIPYESPPGLPLSAYADRIRLFDAWRYTGGIVTADELHNIADRVIRFLKHERPLHHSHSHIPATQAIAQANDDAIQQKLSNIKRMLTTRRPDEYAPIPDALHLLVDTLIQNSRSSTAVRSAQSLPQMKTLFDVTAANSARRRFFERTVLWRGDITSLAVDAIVNAANSELLGCFIPDHTCIDNVIHAAAGPRLRLDCETVVNAQGANEAVGSAKITRAYNLPSRFVIHTVGPQVTVGADGVRSVSQRDVNDLANSYRNCLNLANQVKLNSIAFCCISTGVFGFPQDQAAAIAVATVEAWLEEHADTTISLIVFNVFTTSDERLYQQQFQQRAENTRTAQTPITSRSQKSATTTMAVTSPETQALQAERLISKPSTSSSSTTSIQTAISWIRSAKHILIAAGAGLSASAGLDYMSTTFVKKNYPGLYNAGYPTLYSTFGATEMSEALQWGYLFGHIYNARFHYPQSQVYQQLRDISQIFIINNNNTTLSSETVSSRDHFVITSNADGQFVQNDFDATRLWTMQGDYSLLQCTRPCSTQSFFPIKPYLDAAYPYIDKKTQLLTDPKLIPRCPRCGANMYMNVRADETFLEEPHRPAGVVYRRWLENAVQQARVGRGDLLILEIGVGFNTPSVIRWPMEALAQRNGGHVKLVRINAGHPELPESLDTSRAISIPLDAAEAIKQIHQNLFQ